MKLLQPHERILVALDVDTIDAAVGLVQALSGKVGGFKVGLELVNAVGFDIFPRLMDVGAGRIFYDAKFHDIPNTVAGAVRAAAKRGVWMLNVHTSGGAEMLQSARDAAHTVETPPLMIGVTVLTSIDEATLHRDLRVTEGLPAHVEHLAKLAKTSGMDGVVAAPQELKTIRAACGSDFITVIPGVRPAGTALNDQKRVATPAQAITDGADYLVIGRAITAASDPTSAVDAIVAEIQAVVL